VALWEVEGSAVEATAAVPAALAAAGVAARLAELVGRE